MSEGGIPEEKVLVAETTLKDMFTDLDSQLARREWILVDKMTMADIAWIPQYALFQRNNFAFDPYPNWLAYVARWQKRPAYITAIDWQPYARVSVTSDCRRRPKVTRKPL